MRGVEKLVGSLLRNRFDEDAVRRAGDEVADVVKAGQRRHGFAVGGGGTTRGDDPSHFVIALFIQKGIEGTLPSGAATLDGGAGSLVFGGAFG